MFETAAVSLFIVGLLGGVHCLGMCGGIVGALSAHQATPYGGQFVQQLAYNAGRILSYAAAGGIVGALGQAGFFVVGRQLAPFHYLLANVMLVALGLYLLGIPGIIAPLERAGAILWERLQPLLRGLLPARTLGQSFAVGMLWGWLPCGLVYSALITALGAGSVTAGAGLMAAFGLGTLPSMLLTGVMAVRLRRLARRPAVRHFGGGTVLLLGVYGGLQALGKIIG